MVIGKNTTHIFNMEYCSSCFHSLSILPLETITQEELEASVPLLKAVDTMLIYEFLSHILVFEINTDSNLKFIKKNGSIMYICNYCLLYNQPEYLSLDDKKIDDKYMQYKFYNDEDEVSTIEPELVGSFNRRKWQKELDFYRDENLQWAEFMKQKHKVFRETLEVPLNRKCYHSAILTRDQSKYITDTLQNWKEGKVSRQKQINFLIYKSRQRAYIHSRGTLILQDLDLLRSRTHNVYLNELSLYFTENNMGHTPLNLTYALTTMYYTANTFPAWRVAFYILWKHTYSEEEKSKIINILLRRVPYNNYTNVVYRLVSEDVDVLSLYDSKIMNKKMKHCSIHMQIYDYNYRILWKMAEVGKLPVIKHKKKYKDYRSPLNYNPTFKDVCMSIQPIWNEVLDVL